MTDRRPDPEALLAQVREEERRASRGRLKIFFGSSPGVGKTYAMLEAARARAREGVEVVVGLVETHGRPETAALLEGLEALPRRPLDYRGITLQEFDLDAALARRPALLLVDELAHTNAPGSRHAKRWQDVEELLAAGVGVYATLNVQHLESLNDVVARITGVTVRETLPDAVFDQADEIELADLSADDLLTRLRQGKVYVPDQAAAAIERFFRKGNLIALRELALRRAAERVDAQMRGYMAEAGIHATWPAGERVLVCVGPNPEGARLVRAGKRMATGLKCQWQVVYVERPGTAIAPSDREALVANLQLAELLGATTATLSGHNAAEEILAHARAHNVTRIVAGKPTHPRWRDKLFGSLLDQLVRGSGDVDVYVISGDAEGPGRRRAGRGGSYGSTLGEHLRAAGIIAVCTVLAAGVFRFLSVTDAAMVYLLGVGLVAARYRRGASVTAAALGIAAFDFFFVTPYHTFAVADVRYLLTFAVMLVIALVISGLTWRVRAQAESARVRERRTAALNAMSRELAATRGEAELAAVAARHLAATFGAAAQIVLPDGEGRVAIPVGVAPAFPLEEKERSVAQWVFDHRQPAGLGTGTLPGALARYVPLEGAAGPVGVLGVRPTDPARFDDPSSAHLLETFAAQAAVALERAGLADRAQREQIEAEAERLRTALLSSLSHDMRTPLGAITGAASTLAGDEGGLTPASRRDLAQAILEESTRMNRLIGNLLDMIRVESGALQVQRDWQPLEEVVGVALIRLEARLADHPVTVTLPPDLPLLEMDGLLVEQVFVNLLENAARYTPPGTPIEIGAAVAAGEVVVAVADRGPGLPPGEEERVFDKFYRVAGAAAGGVGLGLTICRGIVTAHGGRIWAERRAGGGAAFRFTLPLRGEPAGVPGEPAAS
jgi:two-component system, OmpR family, sensor histidine kinase KdpD